MAQKAGTRQIRSLVLLLVCVLALMVLLARLGRGPRLPEVVPFDPERPAAVPGGVGERLGPCLVTRVIDGDTVDVRCGDFADRVRLLRIDTPERGQPGYYEARDTLAEMVQGREVYLEFETLGQPEPGTYGRLLAYLYIGDSNLNVEMVRQGWSPFWTKYGTGRLSGEFQKAEMEARQAGRGLWAEAPFRSGSRGPAPDLGSRRRFPEGPRPNGLLFQPRSQGGTSPGAYSVALRGKSPRAS
jgi:endonuclease YncB( thermonuclease family)